MRLSVLTPLALALALALPAQQAGPQPKSQKELDAILAVQNAQDPNARIDAANKLLTGFKDTEFKEFANYMMMLSNQQLNDFENMLLYGEETLKHNPDNVGVLLQLSFAIPTRTREFDLDKDEKLNKAEDFAKRAIVLVPNLEKMNPDMADDEWLLTKKDFMAQAHESIGLVELKRENYDAAVESFTRALNMAANQTGETFYNLAMAYHKAGKKTEAMGAIDKSISNGGMPLANGQDAAQMLKQEIAGAN